MANYQLIADGSGWLSMARTDPDYRGKRVAGLLQESIAHYARGEGVNFLRMLINSSNTPSINSARRGGFKPVTEVAHVTCPLRSLMREEGKLGHSPKGEGGCARLSKLSGIETVQISKSRYLWKMNGFFGQGWHVVKWNASSRRDVAKMIESSGEAFRCDGSTMFMLGRPPEEEGGSHGEFAILTGVFGEAIASVKDVAASSLHLQSIGTFLPFDPYLLRRARAEHGFHLDSWANHGFIFEKRITGR